MSPWRRPSSRRRRRATERRRTRNDGRPRRRGAEMATDETEVERVLGIWLDEVGPKGWYAVSEEIDRRCADEFGGLVEDALAGRLARWQATPRGALALLILLDQLPRNVHRGRAGAYGGDGRARAVAKAA